MVQTNHTGDHGNTKEKEEKLDQYKELEKGTEGLHQKMDIQGSSGTQNFSLKRFLYYFVGHNLIYTPKQYKKVANLRSSAIHYRKFR